jgi:4-diphosphocytidyl-2-C-methyl-D-erythritol kinase
VLASSIVATKGELFVRPANREAAAAKVNLFLHVLARRADGYHLLDSLVVFAGIGDELRGEPAERLSLSVTGEQAASVPVADNLVLRAARALAAAAGIVPRVHLMLEKRLPPAAGLGGGSADAAAALRLLRRMWGLSEMSEDSMRTIAATLGADVPVCLGGSSACLRGVGEVLEPAPQLPRFGLVLANPGAPLATAEVFGTRQGAFSAPARLPAGWADAAAMARDLALLRNDLEAPAIALRPAVAGVLAALRAEPGCLLARMSGSGATCFGLFAEAAEARAAAERLPSGWWRWGGAARKPGRPAGDRR